MIYRRTARGQAGFTILEILIALAILCVMGAGATAVVGQTIHQSGTTTDAMQAIEQVENAAAIGKTLV